MLKSCQNMSNFRKSSPRTRTTTTKSFWRPLHFVTCGQKLSTLWAFSLLSSFPSNWILPSTHSGWSLTKVSVKVQTFFLISPDLLSWNTVNVFGFSSATYNKRPFDVKWHKITTTIIGDRKRGVYFQLHSQMYRQPESLTFSDRIIFWFEKRAVFKREESTQNRSVLVNPKVK